MFWVSFIVVPFQSIFLFGVKIESGSCFFCCCGKRSFFSIPNLEWVIYYLPKKYLNTFSMVFKWALKDYLLFVEKWKEFLVSVRKTSEFRIVQKFTWSLAFLRTMEWMKKNWNWEFVSLSVLLHQMQSVVSSLFFWSICDDKLGKKFLKKYNFLMVSPLYTF